MPAVPTTDSPPPVYSRDGIAALIIASARLGWVRAGRQIADFPHLTVEWDGDGKAVTSWVGSGERQK